MPTQAQIKADLIEMGVELVKTYGFSVRVTNQYRHRRGIHWTADICYQNRLVGTVLQEGVGGQTRVTFCPHESNAWRLFEAAAVKAHPDSPEPSSQYAETLSVYHDMGYMPEDDA